MTNKHHRKIFGEFLKPLVALWVASVLGWAEPAFADEREEKQAAFSTEKATEDETVKDAEQEDESADDDAAAPGPAAEKDAKKPKQKGGKWGGRLRDHAKQGFVNLLGGTGYFLVAPYDKNEPDKLCAPDPENPGRGKAVCSGRAGWHLDMLAGYGVKRGLELFLMFRLGLERPDSNGLVNQPKARQIGPGIKVYTPKDGFFKIGFGIAPLIDFSNRGEGVPRRVDLVIHVPIQAQFDIFPWFGAYVQVAPNFSFIQEFRLELTGGIGVQGRFP